MLLAECWDAIYGMMIAGLLYYRKFTESLTEQGYEANAYGPCVWNKMMTVAQGVVHEHLGMKLDFTTAGGVIVTMIDCLNDVIKAWESAATKFNDGFERVAKRQRIATAAPENLFKVNEDVVKLDSVVAKILYIVKWARPDVCLTNAFLATRVREPDEDDWQTLGHLITYLHGTRELPLVLGATQTGVLQWYVVVLFATHYQDNQSAILLEKNGRASNSKRTKHIDIRYWHVIAKRDEEFKPLEALNESELIVSPMINLSSANEHVPEIERKIRFVKTDYLTKPLQGRMFNQFRDLLMGAVPMWYDVD